MAKKTNYSIHPYLFLNGRCEEAIEFYGKAIGAEVLMLMRNKEAPPGKAPPVPPDWAEKVMHARISLGKNAVILLSDGCPGGKPMEGFSLSLTVPGPTEAQKVFGALSDGGQVIMPLGQTFFSPAFGMVKDRFGVSWMVYVEGAPPQ